MCFFPPTHTSHIIQHLDVGFFGALKTTWERHMKNRRLLTLVSLHGIPLTKYTFGRVFKDAWVIMWKCISWTPPFKQNRHISFRALVALEPLVSLMSRIGPCRARINGDRQTHKPSTVTLAAHARRGLTRKTTDTQDSLCTKGITHGDRMLCLEAGYRSQQAIVSSMRN